MAAVQSEEITKRQYARTQALIDRITNAAPTEWVALRVLCPEMLERITAYNEADAAVAALVRSSAKEIEEAKAAMQPLASFYDQARGVVMAKVPGSAYDAASSFATPHDLLNAAEKLEDVLEEHASTEEGQPEDTAWAAPLFTALVPVLDAAVKEQNEATGAAAELQQAQNRRASAAGAARPFFVQFRRVVRATFGRSSREYRSLLDRRVADEPPQP